MTVYNKRAIEVNDKHN